MVKCAVCGKDESWWRRLTWGRCDECHAEYCDICKKGFKTAEVGFRGPTTFECARCGGKVRMYL